MHRLTLLCLVLVSGCQCRKDPAPAANAPALFQRPTDTVLLPIPDRPWDEGAPDEGWCGETSIQMVALHYGIWAPQPVINSLGRSTHVDLWEEDVPVAMGKLGLVFERAQVSTHDEFLIWIIGHVRAGHPVIVGAKLFPTDHPDWDVDHLMPIVGFSPRGLTFNTNMEPPGQEELPYATLARKDGVSFVSPTGKFYGFAVTGTREGGARVRLRVLEESAASVKLGLQVDPGQWVLHRDDLDGGVTLSPCVEELTISGARSARFTVTAAPPGPSSPSP
jgi:hypothetical protein